MRDLLPFGTLLYSCVGLTGLCTKKVKEVHRIFDVGRQAAQHAAEMMTLFTMAKAPSKKRKATLRMGPRDPRQFPIPSHSTNRKPSLLKHSKGH